MSAKQMGMVWDVPELTHSEMLVLLALADSADHDGYCWPSVNLIAKRTRISSRQVQRILAAVEDRGLIQRRHRRGMSSEVWLCLNDHLKDAEDGVPIEEEVRHDVTPPTTSGCHPTPDIQMSPEPSENRQLTVRTSDEVADVPREHTPHQAMFRAIAAAWKGEPYRKGLLTKGQAKLVGTAAAELCQIAADPSDVPREWQKLRTRYDNPSPAALAKHWGTNGTGPKHERKSLDVVREFIDENDNEPTRRDYRYGHDADWQIPEQRRVARLDSGLLELPDARTRRQC